MNDKPKPIDKVEKTLTKDGIKSLKEKVQDRLIYKAKVRNV